MGLDLHRPDIADDYVTGGGGRVADPSWPVRTLIDRQVPMWDLTIQGLVFSEQTGVSWNHAMRAVLLGKHIRDEWTVREAVRHPTLDDARISKECAMYDLCIVRFGHLQTAFITAYREPTDHVRQTTFSDGTEVVADFAAGEPTVDGRRIACPVALAAS